MSSRCRIYDVIPYRFRIQTFLGSGTRFFLIGSTQCSDRVGGSRRVSRINILLRYISEWELIVDIVEIISHGITKGIVGLFLRGERSIAPLEKEYDSYVRLREKIETEKDASLDARVLAKAKSILEKSIPECLSLYEGEQASWCVVLFFFIGLWLLFGSWGAFELGEIGWLVFMALGLLSAIFSLSLGKKLCRSYGLGIIKTRSGKIVKRLEERDSNPIIKPAFSIVGLFEDKVNRATMLALIFFMPVAVLTILPQNCSFMGKIYEGLLVVSLFLFIILFLAGCRFKSATAVALEELKYCDFDIPDKTFEPDSILLGLSAVSHSKKRVKRKDCSIGDEKGKNKGCRLYFDVEIGEALFDCQIVRFWDGVGEGGNSNDRALVLKRENESEGFDPLTYEGKYGFIVILVPKEPLTR